MIDSFGCESGGDGWGIPTASSADLRTVAQGDGGHALWDYEKRVLGVAADIDDGAVAFRRQLTEIHTGNSFFC